MRGAQALRQSQLLDTQIHGDQLPRLLHRCAQQGRCIERQTAVDLDQRFLGDHRELRKGRNAEMMQQAFIAPVQTNRTGQQGTRRIDL